MLYIQLTKSFSVLFFFFFLIIPSFCSPPPSSFSIMRDSSFSVEVTVVLMFCGERETKRKDVEKKKRDHAPVGGDQAAGGRGCKGLGYLPAA